MFPTYSIPPPGSPVGAEHRLPPAAGGNANKPQIQSWKIDTFPHPITHVALLKAEF